VTKIVHSHLGNEKHIVKKLQSMSLKESMFSEFLKPLPKQGILYTKAINSMSN
jgi:hypothetical protein